MATGSKRAAIRLAWSACPGTFRSLAATYASSSCGGQHPVGYRRGRSCRAPSCRYTRRPAARPRRPAFAVPRNRTPPPAARRPEAATAAWRAAPSGHRLSVCSGYRKRPRATTGSPARSCHRTSLNGAAGRWGHFGGWPGFVTIQRRRRWSRLATGYWWSRRRSAASLVAAWSPP